MKAKISLLQRNSILFLLLGIFAASCVGSYIDVTATAEPILTATLVPTETAIDYSDTPTPSPTLTATESPIPTMINTPTIIEVTPLGPYPTEIYWLKDEDIDADYTVVGVVNVRPCIWMDRCPWTRQLSDGDTVHVILKRTIHPANEVWLMLDEFPVRWVAYTIPGLGTFGVLSDE